MYIPDNVTHTGKTDDGTKKEGSWRSVESNFKTSEQKEAANLDAVNYYTNIQK